MCAYLLTPLSSRLLCPVDFAAYSTVLSHISCIVPQNAKLHVVFWAAMSGQLGQYVRSTDLVISTRLPRNTVLITMLRRVNGVATSGVKIGGYCDTFMVQVLQSIINHLATDSGNQQLCGTHGHPCSLNTLTIVSSSNISFLFAKSSVGAGRRGGIEGKPTSTARPQPRPPRDQTSPSCRRWCRASSRVRLLGCSKRPTSRIPAIRARRRRVGLSTSCVSR